MVTYTWTAGGSDNPVSITNGSQGAGPWIRTGGDLNGKKMDSLTAQMYRVGSSGTLVCYHYSSAASVKSTSDTVNVDTLTTDTSYANHSSPVFDFPSPATILEDDSFVITSDGGSCKLWVSSGSYDNDYTSIIESDDAGSPTLTEKPALTFRGSAVYSVPVVSSGTRLPPPPINYSI